MTYQPTLAEQETVISQTAEDRSSWTVFSNDRVFQAKMRRLGCSPLRLVSGGQDGIPPCYEYALTKETGFTARVAKRPKVRQLTPEQTELLRNRFAQMRAER